MKRYVRAAFDPSMPDWLKKKLTSKYGRLKEGFLKKHIALDRARFLDHEVPNSLPVYLLESDYGNVVYIPGVNDTDTEVFNRRNRQLGSLAKSSLPDRAVDIAWIDLNDPDNIVEQKERYQDPRYSRSGEYGGQYKQRNYLGNNEYEDAGWSKGGQRFRYESGRDKSGYIIPTPESKISQYYSKFPEKITDKVDKIYDRIQEVKQELFDADFNSPSQYGSGSRGDGFIDVERAYDSFSRAIREYRNMLSSLDEDRKLRPEGFTSSDFLDYSLKQFSDRISNIKSYLNEVEKILKLQ